MSAGNKGSSWWSRLRGKSAGQVTGNAGHVVAADDAMFIEFNRIFDAYMRELRNMLGEQFLH